MITRLYAKAIGRAIKHLDSVSFEGGLPQNRGASLDVQTARHRLIDALYSGGYGLGEAGDYRVHMLKGKTK